MPAHSTAEIEKEQNKMEMIDKVNGTFDRKPTEIKPNISSAVIKRLPRYHRCLGELLKEGKMRISSADFSALMGVTASQVRQDLNCFGGFGQQGYGYNIKFLYNKISELLGVDEGYNAVIIGAGKLGCALAATHMFERRGVNRIAMFDIDPEVIGTKIYGVPVYSVDDLSDFCQSNNIHIGVLTVPKEAAFDIAKTLADAGVLGIWNFANMELKLDDSSVVIENIHLGDSLMTLCYEMKTANKKEN